MLERSASVYTLSRTHMRSGPLRHPAATERTIMDALPSDIGPALARLRQAARLTQSDVGPKVRVDQSRISRIEGGDAVPSPSEVRSYLRALDTDDARSYLRYLEREWHFLPRPPQDHPQLDALWVAEQHLRRLTEFE